MQETKHTPGPWVAFPDPNHPPFILIAHKTQDKIIARITTADAPSGGSNKANAELIASAPELLEEVSRYREALEKIAESAQPYGELQHQSWMETAMRIANEALNSNKV